jgi:hypothetical protein
MRGDWSTFISLRCGQITTPKHRSDARYKHGVARSQIEKDSSQLDKNLRIIDHFTADLPVVPRKWFRYRSKRLLWHGVRS